MFAVFVCGSANTVIKDTKNTHTVTHQTTTVSVQILHASYAFLYTLDCRFLFH